ncbi:GNAT family N-acetyltransferase [Streptomyces sp. LBUM 1476]|nr:GNAT family N-acetyltransferase [Streptomyces sp. LBUM 1476]MBZ3917473.1 GNAT family N-acetyltransferase [Streptomyces acidiscabies]GAQ52998.1 putative ribosomal N-acetyltransferase YdaF [Streptomyces acidiscabies]
MNGDSVTLRPVREDDLLVLEAFLVDAELTGPFQWFGWADPARFRRRWAENGMLTDDGGHLTVAADEDPVGFVAWHKTGVTRAAHYWNIGIQLLPDACGRGIGTQAQRLLVRYLFAHSTAQRVEADTDIGNLAEQRALEKLGFTREGVLRSAAFRDGHWRDLVRYSILRDDPTP